MHVDINEINDMTAKNAAIYIYMNMAKTVGVEAHTYTERNMISTVER